MDWTYHQNAPDLNEGNYMTTCLTDNYLSNYEHLLKNKGYIKISKVSDGSKKSSSNTVLILIIGIIGIIIGILIYHFLICKK